MRFSPSRGAALAVVSCALALGASRPARADGKDECLDAYNKTADRRGGTTFYGYGTGYGDADAVDNARADLAKQVRTRIESSASLRETNAKADFDALTTSSVSERLVGLKVQKRCPLGVKSSAFVSLDKTALVGAVREGVSGTLAQAAALMARAEGAAAPVDKLHVLREARAFQQVHRKRAEDDLALCKALQACGELSLAPFDKLAAFAEANRRALSFRYVAVEPVAGKLRQELVKILNRDGIEVSDQAEGQEMRVSCDKRFFPAVKDVAERYLEVRCRGEANVDKAPAFTLNFSGSGAGLTEDQALEFARSQLALDENGAP